MIEIRIVSKKNSVQCHDPEHVGRGPGFIGWADLEPEILFEGKMPSVPRVGETVTLPHFHGPGKPRSAPVKDVEYIAGQSPSIVVTLDWYDAGKMRHLIAKIEGRKLKEND